MNHNTNCLKWISIDKAPTILFVSHVNSVPILF